MPGLLLRLMISLSGSYVTGKGGMTGSCVMAAGSEAEGEVRVQNADGSMEVQPEEELWDATSSSDVSPIANASHGILMTRLGISWFPSLQPWCSMGAAMHDRFCKRHLGSLSALPCEA